MDINTLANDLYENSRKKGFYALEDVLRARATGQQAEDLAILTEHFGNRLMLIAGEAVEAHEELRSGRKVGQLYFSAPKGMYEGDPDHHDAIDELGNLLKPEGVLMELVDVGVRTLETIAGILAQMTPEEKATLRSQVPQSEATEFEVTQGATGYPRVGEIYNVNVAELFMLKAEYNAQRAAMHGRQF